ncbi:hypothetical protein ACFWAR_34335 [Streptomyces sp. NPDC059917]|uniref:hypothetical protein n=1 Tax=Streptomyces sp. NPDC059917 TaxID=3347002 RepID=UPI00365521A7
MTTAVTALEAPPGLADIAAVRERYAALFERRGGVRPGWDRPGAAPPPYLCGSLNGDLPAPAAPGAAALGTGAATLVEVGGGPLRLRYATGLASTALTELGLAGYRPVRPGPRTAARLAEAATSLPDLSPWAAGVVGELVGAVVLLKPRPDLAPLSESLSSCSFDGLPFTVFLTGLGLHRLPPGFMFTQPSVYSLQESLFHQALLLWLDESRRLEDPFRDGRARERSMYVSWCGSWWSAERCLRTLFVYAHLARLRSAGLERASGEEAALLAEALRSALACARELLLGLTERRALLSASGLELLGGVARTLPAPRRD